METLPRRTAKYATKMKTDPPKHIKTKYGSMKLFELKKLYVRSQNRTHCGRDNNLSSYSKFLRLIKKTMSTLKALKTANKDINLTIFGYTREHHDAFLINIPKMICYLCMAYYYIPEFFDKIKHGKLAKISEDKRTARSLCTGSHWTRGNHFNPI